MSSSNEEIRQLQEKATEAKYNYNLTATMGKWDQKAGASFGSTVDQLKEARRKLDQAQKELREAQQKGDS